MNQQLIFLASLAMDLKRAAIGSGATAEVFYKEALARKREINKTKVPLYIRGILGRLTKKNEKEDLLMYSTLLQNYVVANQKFRSFNS